MQYNANIKKANVVVFGLAHEGDAIAYLAQHSPLLGTLAGPFAALLGASIVFISANTGVMGSSRLAFSMSQLQLITKWFGQVDPRFHTPVHTILVLAESARWRRC